MVEKEKHEVIFINHMNVDVIQTDYFFVAN